MLQGGADIEILAPQGSRMDTWSRRAPQFSLFTALYAQRSHLLQAECKAVLKRKCFPGNREPDVIFHYCTIIDGNQANLFV